MRVLMDYRPALGQRSGVGEYAYRLARALLAAIPPGTGPRELDLTLFSSSWKDRFENDPDIAGARRIDHRIPVSVLNWAWHRLEWPKAEILVGARFDVAHSPHPLLLPSRVAAQVVTIHDLDFLAHPERTQAEIRRDYPDLAREHAHRADRIIVPSRYTAREVERRLDVGSDRISVCPHGRPNWEPLEMSRSADGYVLFLGTLEPRKNISGLLDAYERLVTRSGGQQGVPELVIAGRETAEAAAWLSRLSRAPLLGVVRYLGYVRPERRRELYAGARLLVQPSFDEGFGFPVLEAMTLGIPVVAARRGALPEVLGAAGLLVDPEDSEQLATAIERMLEDETLRATSIARGLARARQFDWERSAQDVFQAYQAAIERRQCASA